MNNWESNIRKVIPYTPGDQPRKSKMIKINTNENPYPPAPAVEDALQGISIDALRLYPDPKAAELTKTLADYYHVGEDQVFIGVGSDDVLAMAFLTYFNSDIPIFFPNITYSFYDVWANLYKIPYVQVPLDKDFQIVKEDYYRGNGGVIFPNPNAPTGVYAPLADVEEIIKHNQDVVVIIDEAYIDYGGESALSLVDKYDNLLVVQTFSKSRSLAGMRIGFAIGNPVLIKYLQDVKYSFNSYTMNQAALAVGVAAVREEEYFRAMIDQVILTREWTKEKLQELGFTFPDSQTNFIFATHEKYPAKEIFEALKKENIYVRYFSTPLIDNYLRISIGTDEEMKEFIAFLEKCIKDIGSVK